MKIAYIAGPYRGKTAWEVAQNIRRAEIVGLEVARAGVMPLIPHANTAHFDGELIGSFWIAGTLELMRRCDMMIVLPRSESSVGTQAEIAVWRSEMCDQPVYLMSDDADEFKVMNWLHVFVSRNAL